MGTPVARPGSVALLEIAESVAKAGPKPRRSLLFIWHTGEEEGLFGSRYFTDNPTVPRDSIVAEINVDMIGRGDSGDIEGGGPGYIQVIGSRRLSTELGDLVEKVNTDSGFGLKFDYQFDAPGHPQQYYCRSDHYMYARFGIPEQVQQRLQAADVDSVEALAEALLAAR